MLHRSLLLSLSTLALVTSLSWTARADVTPVDKGKCQCSVPGAAAAAVDGLGVIALAAGISITIARRRPRSR